MTSLKKWLCDNNLNDRQFGEKVGVHQSTVNLWKHGNRMPTPHFIFLIMEVTKGEVGYGDFLDGYRKGGR